MSNQNNLPESVQDFFEKGETCYKYFSEESMDNYWSMDWFIKHLGLSSFVKLNDGTQVFFSHPDFDYDLQVDAGGLGDFFSHKFEVTILEKFHENKK